MITEVADPVLLPAFSACGIELEYMIVDRRSYAVLPVADRLIHAVCGAFAAEVEQGPLAWSNELVLHVVELKTNGPAPQLAPLPAAFQAGVTRINALLEPLGGCLMPGGAHPWMDPDTETRLWPHEYNAVYESYDRIFGCRGHGWSNLQSVHVNLPFCDDVEFARLHTAIRVVLPLLPALAASTPIIAGQVTGLMDTRLHYYRSNARRIQSITGQVVPEPATSRAEYERMILAPMYRDIAPHDPGGILQHEWLNSRGAIARFDRNAIEIRLLDIQEYPGLDLAIAAAVIGATRLLYEQRWSTHAEQLALPTARAAALLAAAERDAERAVTAERAYLALFGFPGRKAELLELWQHLLEQGALAAAGVGGDWHVPLQTILTHGPLARRLLRATGTQPRAAHLRAAAAELCACLADGRPFLGLA